MHLNPYGQDAVLLIVDLTNDPPKSVENLVERCSHAGLVVDMPVDERDLQGTLALIEWWCRLLDASDEAHRVEALNQLLAEAATHPRVTDHAGEGWHLHYRDDDVPLAQVLRAIVSVGTALHLTGRGMDRIGRCALPECTAVFADTSRTGRRRYCSARCANRRRPPAPRPTPGFAQLTDPSAARTCRRLVGRAVRRRGRRLPSLDGPVVQRRSSRPTQRGTPGPAHAVGRSC